MPKLPSLQLLIIIQVLRKFQQKNGWASAADIALEVNADKSNALRGLYSLQEMGWLKIAPHQQETGGRPANLFKMTSKGEKEYNEVKVTLSKYGIHLA